MKIRRIVVTGGPGGGKTTVWQALARRYAERVVAVPEVATLMFRHVFPPVRSESERRAVQGSIFRVQHDFESVHAGRLKRGQVLLCDRGTPDGGGYWPTGHTAFFEAMGSSCEQELMRYETVLFMETAAAGGYEISDGNPTRLEDLATATAIDERLLALWSSHPHLERVPHQPDFAKKIAMGCEVLERWLDK